MILEGALLLGIGIGIGIGIVPILRLPRSRERDRRLEVEGGGWLLRFQSIPIPAFGRQIIYNFLTDAGQPVGKHWPMLREMNPCHVHPTTILSCLTDRWMCSLWLLALGLLLGLQAGCTTKPPPPPTALQKLQGTWSGGVLNDRSKAQYTLRIRGDSFHFHRDTNFWFGTTITVPAGTDPQQLFATIHTSAPGQENSLGKRVAAIFQVEEDNLIIVARGDGGDDVPTGFDVAGDEGLTRYELRRVAVPR